MRLIAVVTGTRADYGYLKPLMKKINEDKDLKLLPIITGMHMLKNYGDSFKLVETDFSNTIKVNMNFSGSTKKDMVTYLSSGISNLSDVFEREKPDIIIALGDRSEAFAAAIASVYLNIPFAHINGGDISGTTLDESIRHCITKLAHIHFVHTKDNALRVKKMGEENERIFISGALTLDTIVNKKLIGKKNIFKKYNLDTEQTTFLVIFHPITTLSDYGLSQLTQLFSALKSLKKQTIVIYPNNDAGSRQFIEFIEQNRCKDFLHIFKNLPYIDYLSLMKSCDVMIGNSSSGIIEAPSFQVPVINIGNRQQGRQRSDNILDVEPDEKEILEAIDFALNDVRFKEIVNQSSNTFGDGTASDKIVNVLKQINLSEKLIQKQITY